ncbi:MAG: type IV toxin-antitoxin system AbiEi family antitoxin domain-containing protein [Actinomycetota bacterium]
MPIGFVPPSVLVHLAAHHGVASRDQLRGVGITSRQIDRLLASGHFERELPGVYRIASTPSTFEGRCLAACLADRELVIGGPSAARLWRFKHTGADERVIGVVAHDRNPIRSGVVLRRTNQLPATDVVTRSDGVRLTAPPRRWFDRARDLTDPWFEALTEHVLDQHCSVPTLWGVARRLMTKGRTGSARVRRVMSQRAAWQKPADSTLEFDVLRSLERLGIVLTRQYALRLRDSSVIHLDGADPDLRWGVEIDHVTWHGGRIDAARDKGRDRRARQLGWQIERVDDQEWRRDRSRVIAELVDLYEARGGRRRLTA